MANLYRFQLIYRTHEYRPSRPVHTDAWRHTPPSTVCGTLWTLISLWTSCQWCLTVAELIPVEECVSVWFCRSAHVCCSKRIEGCGHQSVFFSSDLANGCMYVTILSQTPTHGNSWASLHTVEGHNDKCTHKQSTKPKCAHINLTICCSSHLWCNSWRLEHNKKAQQS